MKSLYKTIVSVLSVTLVLGMLLAPLAPLFPIQAAEIADQTIEVCFITFDNEDNILQSLPGNTSVSIDLYTDSSHLVEGQTNSYGTSFIPVTQTFESANRDILNADGIDDSYCVTQAFSNPANQEYTYTPATVTSNLDWLPIRYNDQNNIDFVDLDIAFPYSDEWFDAIPGNEVERNTNSDGHIIMNAERPNRRLLVVSQLDINLPQYAVVFSDSAAATGEYTLSTVPNTLNPSENINLRLSVQNMGELVWHPGNIPANTNPVNISYHWRNKDTGQYVVYGGNRAMLNQPVSYTQNDSNIALNVAAPDIPGNYELIIDLVHEGVTWFSSAGAATYTIPIQISSPEPVINSFSLPAISMMAISSGSYYTVQPYQGGSWHCGGYDCLAGIAEDYYQCSANGIPNDASWGDMTTKCWWPIYAANQHLYSYVPPVYGSAPWNYIEVGWNLHIPPSNSGPVVPPPPANASNFGGIAGASTFDPYAGMYGSWSAWPEVTFDRWVAWDGSYKVDAIKWSETRRPPTPTITGINTDASGTAATIYGVAIPKGHPMHIKVWNEFRYCWACGSGWEYHYQQGTAQHVKVVLFKNNWEYIGQVWNDSPDGRWNITLPVGTTLRSGDRVFAEVQVEADYTFSGLKWWSNTYEAVNFNLRDPKYTGYPYFASGGSNSVVVPSVYVDIRSIEERWIDQLAIVLGSSGGSSLTNVCGYPAKTYSNTYQGNSGAIIFVNGRAIYSYGGTWDTFNYYADRCERFGIPINNPYVGGNGPFNTPGAYQDFAKGRIYWSWKYQGKFVYGAIGSKFEQLGGTHSIYGWPTSEVYQVIEGGVTTNCQEFEGGRICEKEIVDHTIQNFQNKESIFGNINRLGEVHDYCGTKIQDYNYIGSYGRSSLILNPDTGNIHLLTGGLAYTYFNNGSCDKFGYPANDPGVTAGNDGWWQEFSKDTTIYWHKDSVQAQGKWVSGAVRTYHNTLGGTASYLSFPQNIDKQSTSRCGTSGEQQEFVGGKIYRSGLATVDMPYNDWIYQYWNKGEVAGDYGWPTSKLANIDGVETMTFEAGDMYGRTGALGIGWWIEDRVVGCARKTVERTYNIKLMDGNSAWTDEEIGQVAEAMSLVPLEMYEGYLQEVVRDDFHKGIITVAGLTDPNFNGRKIVIYDRAQGEVVQTMIHELMHVYQFRYGGQTPLALKVPNNPVIENYYITAGFAKVNCDLPAYQQKCNVRNIRFEYLGDCERMEDFVSEYAMRSACDDEANTPYWEEMAEVMTFYIMDKGQFTNFNEEVDWPSSGSGGHYDGEPKSSELLLRKFDYVDKNIF